MVVAEVLSRLKSDYDAAEELLAVSDPVETPFKSRYEGRDKLSEMVETLASYLESDSSARAMTVHLLARIGSVDHEVEEWHKCQETLERALALAKEDSKGFKDLVIIPELVCANQLGILWCNRGDMEKSKLYLNEALDTFTHYKRPATSQNAIHNINDLLCPEFAAPGGHEQERALELLNTHTNYYLAQLYEKMGDANLAGEFCHVTLKRQLELNEYRPLDWCSDAATLSHHYVVKDMFADAKQHLCAARFVLEKHRLEMELKERTPEEKEEAEEALAATSAKIDRAWGKYCLVLLKASLDAVDDDEGREDGGIRVENIEDQNLESTRKVTFESMEVDPQLQSVPTLLATNFEEARDIFVSGQRLFMESQRYFCMEEHCSDFTEINQDLSLLYKILASFEPEADRKCKMHKRRIDLLEAPLSELNEAMYLLLCRQLIYEIAEAYERMMDIKLDVIKKTDALPSPAQVSKVNSLAEKSISYFERYLDTIKNCDGDGTRKMPNRFPMSVVRPALIAYFHLARLNDRVIVIGDPDRKLKNKVRTFCYFKSLVDYCERNPEDAAVVEAELPVCAEMCNLLPIKIEKMRSERAAIEAAARRNNRSQQHR